MTYNVFGGTLNLTQSITRGCAGAGNSDDDDDGYYCTGRKLMTTVPV